ncbi:MAG: hypothetical protein K8T89_06270 [Planctomycetes bacterium]|nr:hypothetical protein [Planctomycetota bacterium]
MTMHASAPEIAISYAPGGPRGKRVITFAAKYLQEFEARNPDPVEIAILRPDLGGARWTEKGRTPEIEFPLLEPGSVPAAPEPPKEFVPMPQSFLAALDQASTIAARDPTKYALNRVQLRGQAGTVLSSDQRQLFQAGGFNFPFTEDLLIPRSGLFGLAPFTAIEEISMGRTDTHVVIRVGLWTFFFFIDKQGRFPDVTPIIPKPSHSATRLRLDAEDVQIFLDSLTRRLKGPEANEMALTLDLMGTPCLRFEIEKRVSEVKLMNSEVTGKPLRMCLNLHQFLSALELRFLNFEIRDPDKPILARDGERLYLSMPLPASGAILPRSEKAPSEQPMPSTALAPIEKPATPTIVVPVGSMPVRPAGGFDVLGEAEGLREGLFKVAAHAGRILQFLREVCTQQKVTQIVRSSLLALTESAHGEKP